MKKYLITIMLSLVMVASYGQLDTVNVGAYNNDPSADKARTAFIKLNQASRLLNTVRLYNINQAEMAILDGALVTTAEVNRLVGVTSAIQTQINNKLAVADTTTMLSKYANKAHTEARLNDTTVMETVLITEANLITVGDTTVTAFVPRIVFRTADTHLYVCRKLTGKKWYQIALLGD